MPAAVRDGKNLSGQTMGTKGLKTRRKLIDTTVGLLAKTSLRDLRVVDIAQAAETSSATFYIYFDGVIDVVLAAVAETSQSTPELIGLLDGDWDPASDTARRFIRLYIDTWDEHRALFRTRNLAAEEGDERFVHAREDATRGLLKALAGRIGASQAAGMVPPSIAAEALAATLLMMLERLGALSHIHRERRARIPHEQLIAAAAETLSWAVGSGTTSP